MAATASKEFIPAYLRLPSSELEQKAASARRHLEDCDLCARYCRVDRTRDVKGAVCRTGVNAIINSFGPHMGEESCLTGWRGSGTVFSPWCNLRCIFCQN